MTNKKMNMTICLSDYLEIDIKVSYLWDDIDYFAQWHSFKGPGKYDCIHEQIKDYLDSGIGVDELTELHCERETKNENECNGKTRGSN